MAMSETFAKLACAGTDEGHNCKNGLGRPNPPAHGRCSSTPRGLSSGISVAAVASSALPGFHQQSDFLRDANLRHVEAKVSATEEVQAKLERKISELTGCVRGLVEEAQLQSRRADGADARFWEWRHQIEEQLQQKQVELELQVQETASSMRVLTASTEESHRKLTHRCCRMEEALKDRRGKQECADETMALVSAHLQEMERKVELKLEQVQEVCDIKLQDMKQACTFMDSPEMQSRSCSVCSGLIDQAMRQHEWRVTEIRQILDRLLQEAHGEAGWIVRLQEHEVRLNSMRSRVDSQASNYSSFEERVRSEWESRFDQLRRLQQETSTQASENCERLSRLSGQAERCDQVLEELCFVRACYGGQRVVQTASSRDVLQHIESPQSCSPCAETPDKVPAPGKSSLARGASQLHMPVEAHRPLIASSGKNWLDQSAKSVDTKRDVIYDHFRNPWDENNGVDITFYEPICEDAMDRLRTSESTDGSCQAHTLSRCNFNLPRIGGA